MQNGADEGRQYCWLPQLPCCGLSGTHARALVDQPASGSATVAFGGQLPASLGVGAAIAKYVQLPVDTQLDRDAGFGMPVHKVWHIESE
jgi:hypothetical protein